MISQDHYTFTLKFLELKKANMLNCESNKLKLCFKKKTTLKLKTLDHNEHSVISVLKQG